MRSIHSQLFANQLWETISLPGKASFLFVLTLVMLRVWGATGYGEFAVATSTMVFVSMFDLGLRGRLRVDLSHSVAAGENDQSGRILAGAIAGFLLIGSLLCLGVWRFPSAASGAVCWI